MNIVSALCLFIVGFAYVAAQQHPGAHQHSIDDLPLLPKGPCEEGKTYRDLCNTCVCGKDGVAACTTKACPPKTKRETASQECSPGETKKEHCNTCRCANGQWACTRKQCLEKRSAGVANLPPLPKGPCEPGKSYKDDCNTCNCGPTGLAVCTLKACVSRPKREAASQECSPGETKKEHCNTCRCANGQWACTRKQCLEKRSAGVANLPPLPKGPCEPGKSYKDDCNTCNCGPTGLAVCTLKACVSRPKREAASQECSPGETKKEHCNTCRCANGQWACTRKQCLEKRSAGVANLPPLPKGPCEPGKSYKDDCNTCNCGPTGLAVCTLKACVSRPKREAASQECSPGETKKEHCNTCRCANGQWACTRKQCLEKRSAGVANLPPLPKGPCEPGKSYKDDCNTCNCGPTGLAVCTLKACVSRPKREAASQECSPGETKKEHCNTCRCANGQWACTRKQCLEKRSAGVANLPPLPKGPCEPGKSYKDDCNTCNCGPTGLAVCTLKACVSRPKREAASQECSPGETKKEHCNTCRCANGQWACTRKQCLEKRSAERIPPLPSGSCKPGTSYKADCNTCHCGPTGIPICTLKACPPKQENQAGVANLPPLPKGPCEPGKSYKDDCNTCHCGPTGLAVCTLKACVSRPKREAASQECSPGETKKEHCNTCRCANGQWACTRKQCLEKRSAGSQKCAPGQTKREHCNTCRCANGFWACTRKQCLGKRSAVEKKCNPPEYKKIDCNNCKCVAFPDGSTDWACTKMACLTHQLPRSRRDVSATTDLKNTPCAPNDVFQLDCNTCYCNSAKTGYLCTDNICAPDNSTEISSTSTATDSTILVVTTVTQSSTLSSCVTQPPEANTTEGTLTSTTTNASTDG